MTLIIDGKKIAQNLRNSLQKEIGQLKSKYGKVPGLAVVQVGNVTASSVYEKQKLKVLKKLESKLLIIIWKNQLHKLIF